MMELALKLTQTLAAGKGRAKVTLKSIVALEGDQVEVVFADDSGEEFVMQLHPRAAAVVAAAAAPAPAPAPEPAPPTTMAPLARASAAVSRIAQSPKLPAEARSLVQTLDGVPLRPGDEVRLVQTAQAASAGDLEPLRILVRQYSPPREVGA